VGIGVEREIKFPISSWQAGETLLRGVAGRIREPRYREINSMFDFPDGSLRARGDALRLRRARGSAWLTFKAPVSGEARLKHRAEYESAVSDADAIERVLNALGLREQFRYEKYRQVYVVDDLEACLDETPIGCYLELEGAGGSIRALAERLGWSLEDGVVLSYPELYEAHRRRVVGAPAYMVFPQVPDGEAHA